MSVDAFAESLYVALVGDPKRLGDLRRLQYRCATERRCLLLDAIETPTEGGILLHQKRYKYSDGQNLARSSEAGRRANTFDGQNHWRPRSYFIGVSALVLSDDGGARLGLTCDHVLEFLLEPGGFRHDWDAGHAEVRVRPDGSRYAVR